MRGPIAGCGWSAGRDGCASPIRPVKLPPVSTQHRIRLDHRGGIVRSLLRLQSGLFRPGLIEFVELFLDFLLPFQGRIDVFSRRRSGRLDDLGRFALFGRFRRVGDMTFVIDDLVDVICEKARGHQGDATQIACSQEQGSGSGHRWCRRVLPVLEQAQYKKKQH